MLRATGAQTERKDDVAANPGILTMRENQSALLTDRQSDKAPERGVAVSESRHQGIPARHGQFRGERVNFRGVLQVSACCNKRRISSRLHERPLCQARHHLPVHS
ncbi:MAG: hypothetical protein Q4D19_07855 [Lautropia sp.]|nr:hypothetical protein [Lautropia sp.]